MGAEQPRSLTAPLGEIAGPFGREDEAAASVGRDLEPLASFELPTDRAVTTAQELAARAAAPGGRAVHVTGAVGGATGLVLRALVTGAKRKVVAVTPDLESARALAADASFLLGARDADDAEAAGASTLGEVLLYLPNESSPYADVNPDRRAAQTRLATLFHMAMGLPWSVLVLPVTALARKVVPSDEVLEHAELIVAGQEIDREALAARLVAGGYVRSPLVEDPGSFAVRGALLDVWAPCAERPARIELYGDLIMSIKTFDPEDQRTVAELADLWLTPAREAVLTRENLARAKDRVRAVCDAIELPSSKARALVDDIATGRVFFGAEGFLPAYVDLAPFGSYVPADAVVVLEDPAALTRALRDELGRALSDQAQKNKEAHFGVADFYEPEEKVAGFIAAHTAVVLHRTGIEGEGALDTSTLERSDIAPPDTPSLATFEQSDI
jgi:transcription-repair coupling factor (superfamily II helicase)